ncbi:MAG TPA: FAD-dependent oxidoreductase, partial [Candidatus Sumerlaeota bacterium]|nr:FAD-dependent oxidoreductase [Candidatus Sumerlaeota bacterium]
MTAIIASSLRFDIVVSGGSLSAPAAALAAARNAPNAKVLLIEPTDWLGGQATSQGVSAIDNAARR